MPRNATVVLHKCFDPSQLAFESVGQMTDAFVRFPKPDCTCTARIRFSERNAMLADGSAVVVLRNGAVPSVDKFTWKEVVAVRRPGRVHLRVPQATTASGRQRPHQLSQIERATAIIANFTDADFRDHRKKIQSNLESLVARMKSASPDEMPILSDRIGKLNLELRELSASLNERERIGSYERVSVYPYVRLSWFSVGAVLETVEQRRLRLEKEKNEKRK
jgi:hypothetical protein